jgi:hypothetical protein
MKQYYMVSIDSMDAEKGLEPEDIYSSVITLTLSPRNHIRSVGVREVSLFPWMVGMLIGLARLRGTKSIEPQILKGKRL